MAQSEYTIYKKNGVRICVKKGGKFIPADSNNKDYREFLDYEASTQDTIPEIDLSVEE